MPHPDNNFAHTPLRAPGRIASFKHAFAGISLLVRSQTNARLHLCATGGVVAAGSALHLPATEWALLSLAMGGVWAAEALNTAVETVVNLVSPQWHELAKDAKDLAAGGVLLATLAAVATGLLVFYPHVLALLD